MTIKDIAKLSGVSVSTVSRVLNNRPDVSEVCRSRVNAVIQSSNYIPNNSARDLVKIRSDAIGLVVRGVSNSFYTDIIRSIEKSIDAAGYTMVMRHIASCDDEVKCGAEMEREKRLRGIVFLGGCHDYTKERIKLLNVPFVCCSYTNRYGDLDDDEYSSVSIADEDEAYKAVNELYRNGHRRIAALISTPDDWSISQLRYRGYRRALSGLTRYNISGLGLSGGWVEDVYVIVIMGGSLSFMRNVYRRILANEDFCALLCKDRPFIENNRLARMPELESFGMVDENGAFLGGNCCFGLTVR